MRIALLLIILLTAMAVYPFCSCTELKSLDSKEYNNSDLIVQGVVKSIEVTENHLKTITMEIKKVYKGEVTARSLKISTAKKISSCGLNIGISDEWIIYAYEQDGIYQTNSCTHSSSLPPRDFQSERVEDDLKFLDRLQAKKESALKFLNANQNYFENIVIGEHNRRDYG